MSCQIAARIADVEDQRHPTRSEWLWAELGLLREQHCLARHPYWKALREGRLSRADLQILAAEHQHVIAATASVAHRAATVGGHLATLYAVVTAQSDVAVDQLSPRTVTSNCAQEIFA